MKQMILFAAFALISLSAEKKVQMKDLPAPVQKTVAAQTQNATIKSIVAEREKGKLQYEVESVVNGRSRDFVVNPSGEVVEVEEETSIEAIPGPAKAAILKKAGEGSVVKVETVTREGKTSYEAAYKSKSGRKGSVSVTADGHEAK